MTTADRIDDLTQAITRIQVAAADATNRAFVSRHVYYDADVYRAQPIRESLNQIQSLLITADALLASIEEQTTKV
jgi:hypothetical protein